jgi:hypothetical protein
MLTLVEVAAEQGNALQPLLKIAGIVGGIVILIVAIRVILGKKV